MILYNTTFVIDLNASPDHLMAWAEREYIPAAMASPGVAAHTFALIDTPAEQGTRAYALQFLMADEAAAAVWETTAAPLRSRLEALYGKGRVVWFSTYMDIISQSSQSINID